MSGDEMKQMLTEKLQASEVQVIDDSAQHAGHQQASGGGHFSVLVVSNVFEGKGTIDRHRMVYDVLSMGNNPAIHALSVKAVTPAEWTKR